MPFHLFLLSSKRYFWSAGTVMSIGVHSFVSLYTTLMSGRLCSSWWSVKIVMSQVILTSLFSSTGKGWWSYPCRNTITHTCCIASIVPVEPPCRGAFYILSGQASCIHRQYATLFQWIHHTVCTVVSQCLIYAVLVRICSQSLFLSCEDQALRSLL